MRKHAPLQTNQLTALFQFRNVNINMNAECIVYSLKQSKKEQTNANWALQTSSVSSAPTFRGRSWCWWWPAGSPPSAAGRPPSPGRWAVPPAATGQQRLWQHAQNSKPFLGHPSVQFTVQRESLLYQQDCTGSIQINRSKWDSSLEEAVDWTMGGQRMMHRTEMIPVKSKKRKCSIDSYSNLN